MTNTKTCKIKVLSKTYEIKCPEDEATNLTKAGKKLQKQIQSNKTKFKTMDNFELLLLSALDIAHELVISKNEQEQHKNQVSQFISSLENKINHMVSGAIDKVPQND